jgi:alpha-2-macroglobulin
MKRFLTQLLKIRNLVSGAILLLLIIIGGTVVMLLADQPQDKPDLAVQVDDFKPNEYLSGTTPTNIIVKFSRDMVPNEQLDKLISDPPLYFNPPISGLAKWTDNNTLIFMPDTPFKPSTIYLVEVKSDKTFLYGNHIAKDIHFSLRTPVFAVTSTWQELIEAEEYRSKILIHIELNYPADPVEFVNNVTKELQLSTGKLKLELSETAPSQSFTMISEPFLTKNIHGAYSFVIKKGMKCVDGQLPLQGDYKYDFSIPEPSPLVIQSVWPDGAGPNSQIYINLSSSVLSDDIDNYISITPEINFQVTQQYYRIELLGDFKPRETYTVNIKKGLKALNGQTLDRDFSSVVQIGDIPPRITFPDNGLYLAREGGQRLAVETANIDEIAVEVEQIFVNNIVYYLNGGSGYYGEENSRLGRTIFSKDYKLNSTLNVPLTSTIDVGKIVGDTLHGLYSVSVRKKNERWTGDTRRVMISDIGIIARLSDNYLMVWSNSLDNTKAISGAKVSLISGNNQILLEGRTDSKGIAVFEDIAEKTKGFMPFVITVEEDNDLSYLPFSECMINTSDFNTDGRPYLSRGYEAFIYSDRGVYRPGETAHLVSVVRPPDGMPPQEFPYMVTIDDPQGIDFAEYKISTKDQGLSALDIEIPSFAKTGAYKVTAKIGDDVIGSYSFQVEEFMPDRIKTAITTDKDSYNAGDEIAIGVNGVYLFGPPCSGNDVTGHITIEKMAFRPSGWSQYRFDDESRDFTALQVDLPNDKLDEQGNQKYTYHVSPNLKPPSALQATISATVREDGGRAVSDYKRVAINPYPFYLGLKRNFDGYAQAGQQVSFGIAAVTGDGKEVTSGAAWAKFYRVTYQNIVKRDRYGIYRYVSESKDQILDSTTVDLNGGSANVSFTPGDYGAYKVKVGSDQTGHVAALEFYASGWGYSSWSMANPDRIELELDKKIYAIGDKAKLLVKAPFEGKLLLTIERDKVVEFKTYDLDSNTAEILIPVKKEFTPNVYISATLIKSTKSLERFSPARAFGLIPLMVDNSATKVAITIDAPAVIKPRQKLDITISSNYKKGTQLTVAAVDLGILQLTDFSTPDPFNFFYGKKRPALQPYDIYSLIYPDIKEAESKLLPAGSSAYGASRKRHLNPINARRVRPVALWSGVVTTDINGAAHVSFDLPQFNGKLLVMAVAFNGNKSGSASAEVTVRDKIVIQENLPRFIAGGDQVKSGVVIFNNTGVDNNFDITMNIDGPANLLTPKTVTLKIPANGKSIAEYAFKGGDAPGKVKFEIVATDGSERAIENVELANRPGQPLQTIHGSGVAKASKPAHLSISDKWLPGTDEYELRISAMPTVRLAASIQYLLQYPYGCIEQTTSRLFPLLYFNDLARFLQPGIFGTKGQDYFIGEGIVKVTGMQVASGGFSYWQGDDVENPWASVWASHFLVEARKSGYTVSDKTYNKMIENLERMAKNSELQNDKTSIRIYAAYVLAKAGKLEKSVLNNLKMLNLDTAPLYTKFQLAAAIAMTSGVNDALYLIPAEVHPLKFDPETGGDFNSDIRANSILLDVLSEIAPDNPSIPQLVNELSEQLYIGEWYTTQSNAFALLALGKYFKTQETPNYTGTVVVDGKKLKPFTTADLRFSDKALAAKDIEISINGTGTCYFYWQSSGVSSERSVKEFDNRLRVRREFLNSDGAPLDLGAVKLGDQIVAKVTLEAIDKALSNVAISDLLPSCLEIENPRLATSGKLSWLPRGSRAPSYLDIRDDRMLLFTDAWPGDRFVYYYSLRVVSRGEFNVPPISADCMYDPTIASTASAGHMIVSDSK